MTRSSRHKSHKQSKRSTRDDGGCSDSEVDSRMKEVNGKGDGAVRVSRDLGSGEERRLAFQSRDGNDRDSPCHGNNGDASEEHSSSRRRRDRADRDGKTGRRHDGGSEKEEEVVNEKEESKKGRVGSKGKLEKELGRKEVQPHKQSKEEEYGSDKDSKVQDVKCDNESQCGDDEVKRRRGSQLVDFGEVREVKPLKNAESPLRDDSRNPEFEKELDKRIRRTDGSSGKEKYQDDVRENDEKRSSSRGDHAKDGKYRDGRQKVGNDRDKYREDIDRDYRHRHSDGKQREDMDRKKRHRDDKYRDDKYREDRALRDHPNNRYDSKHARDENNALESHHKKLRSQNNDRDGSPLYDDRRSRHKDDKERRRFDDRDDRGDLRSQSVKEQRYDAEKKSSTGKLESDTDRGRSYSRHIDLDSGLGHNRRRISPNSSSHVKDQHRLSNQTDSKFKHLVSEERAWSNAVSTKEIAAVSGVLENASVCRSMEKSLQKDDDYLGELSAERCQNSDVRGSPILRTETSPSSPIDRRFNRATVWRSNDTEDSRHGISGSKDASNYSGKESKGDRDLLSRTHSGDELSQIDGDNLTVSSPFGRHNSSSNTKSFLLPPPSVCGSSEDDNRVKSNNRDKRIGDLNAGRAWKGTPHWPSPVANGFIHFQHGPPPVGFHPVMQQFPAPSMFGIRSSRELNDTRAPYLVPDSDRFPDHAHPFGWKNPMNGPCPPPFHAWDANNGVMVNDSHMYGRLDWDHSRTMMGSQGWETSVDMWKQNGGVALEVPSLPYKEDQSVPAPLDVVWPDQVAQSEQNELNLRAESVELNQSAGVTRDTSEASEDLCERAHKISKISRDDRARLSHFYLAKLEISADLTHPELYNQCSSLMELEQNRAVAKSSFQLVHAEVETGVRVKFSSNPSASLFPALNDSVFQGALSLYKRQKEETEAIFPSSLSIRKEALSHDVDHMECALVPSQEQGFVLSASKQETSGEAVPTCDTELVEDAVNARLDLDATDTNKVEPDPTNMLELEVDPVLNSADDQILTAGDHLPSVTEEHQKEVDNMCDSLLLSDVPSQAFEGGMKESIDSGLVVNLSRIHQSQSTH